MSSLDGEVRGRAPESVSLKSGTEEFAWFNWGGGGWESENCTLRHESEREQAPRPQLEMERELAHLSHAWHIEDLE